MESVGVLAVVCEWCDVVIVCDVVAESDYEAMAVWCCTGGVYSADSGTEDCEVGFIGVESGYYVVDDFCDCGAALGPDWVDGERCGYGGTCVRWASVGLVVWS